MPLRWHMEKQRIVKEDGRFLYFYRFHPVNKTDGDPPSRETPPEGSKVHPSEQEMP